MDETKQPGIASGKEAMAVASFLKTGLDSLQVDT